MKHSQILTNLKQHFALNPQTATIIVIGLGITGGSVARYLHQLGLVFTVIDSRDNPPLLTAIKQQCPNATLLTGGFHSEVLTSASHLIVSPGIALIEPSLQQAINNGAIVLSDIDLFACATNKPIIAITGSNGKSTVTTMVGDMARADNKIVGVGGNLGTPVLDLLDDTNDLYVLELSSFQLERTSLLNATAATVLNISADHFDRHGDIKEYAEEKQKVFRGDGVMVLNNDDKIVTTMRDNSRNTLSFSIQQHNKADFYLSKYNNIDYLTHNNRLLMPLSALPLEGKHNAANALAALALGFSLGLNTDAMCAALKQFQGLAHRMNKVAVINTVNWINDSKATNIGATIAALAGYTTPVILLAGGDAKGADMTELTPVVKEKCKAVVLMGKDAVLIEQALNNNVPCYHAENMQEAVYIAAHLAKAGDTVLLSPACASLDQYKSYADRGEQFKQAVLTLAMNTNTIS